MKNSAVWINRLLTAISTAALGTAAVFLISAGVAKTDEVKKSPGHLPSPGTDTIAYLFLSSTCPACRAEPGATQLRAAVAKAVATPDGPHLVGVGIESDVAAGAEYLSEVGPFDEIALGHGWSNTLANKLLWDGADPIASVPQLVLVQRITAVVDSPFSAVTADSVVRRVVGLAAINQWLDTRQGANRQ